MKLLFTALFCVELAFSAVVVGQQTYHEIVEEYQQQYRKYQLSEKKVGRNVHSKGPDVNITIMVPDQWDVTSWIYKPSEKNRFWVYASDAEEEIIVYLLACTADDPDAPVESYIRSFIEYGYAGIDEQKWNARKMKYSVDSPGAGKTRVEMECTIRMNDEKGKMTLISLSDGKNVLISCAAGLTKQYGKSKDMLLTIAESMRLSQGSELTWEDPRFNDPSTLFASWDQYIRDGEKTDDRPGTARQTSTARNEPESLGNGPSPNVTLKQVASSGSSFILQSNGTVAAKAGAVAMAAIHSAAHYFDDTPELVGGLCTYADDEAHLLFRAKKNGIAYAGLALASRHKSHSGQTVSLFCDAANRFNKSLPDLLNGHSGGTGSSSGKQVRPEDLTWQWHRSGTEQVKLPAGWSITYTDKGVVGGKGPQGSFMLGFYSYVRYPNIFDQGMPNGTMSASAPYQEPLSALVNVFPKILAGMARAYGQSAPSIAYTIYDHKPAAAPMGMTAEYIHCRCNTNGTVNDELCMVATSQAGGSGSWMYYYSAVAAPVGKLELYLPVLLEIWASRSTDPAVFQERINHAMRDMNITTRTMQETIRSRNESIHNSFLGWDQYIRGYGQVLNTDTGKLYDVDLGDMEEIVDLFNERAGRNLFRVVEPSERWQW